MEVSGRYKKTAVFFDRTWNFLLEVSIIFLIIVCQTTVCSHIEFFGVRPSPALVYCVCRSIKKECFSTLVVVAVIGFFLDTVCGRQWTVSTLLYVYIALGCMILCENLLKRSFKTAIFCVPAATILYRLIICGFCFIFLGESGISHVVIFEIFPEMLYNISITPIIYFAGKMYNADV